MEPAQVTKYVHRRIDSEQQGERADPVGDHRQRCAGVRDDELDPGVQGDGAVEHEVDDGPGGVEEELHHRPGTVERRLLPAGGRCGVDEQTGAAPVQFVKDRFEGAIPQVGPSDVRQ